MTTDRRDPGGPRGMRVIAGVEEELRRRLPPAGLRLAYQAAYLALKPYWLIARPSVVGGKVVVRHGGDVLLLRHSYARRNVWDLPGGFIDARERAVDAVYRELREEVGIDPPSLRCIARESMVTDHRRETILTFVCDVTSRDVTPSPAEVDRAEWFPASALPPKTTRFTRRMVARAGWRDPPGRSLPTR